MKLSLERGELKFWSFSYMMNVFFFFFGEKKAFLYRSFERICVQGYVVSRIHLAFWLQREVTTDANENTAQNGEDNEEIIAEAQRFRSCLCRRGGQAITSVSTSFTESKIRPVICDHAASLR